MSVGRIVQKHLGHHDDAEALALGVEDDFGQLRNGHGFPHVHVHFGAFSVFLAGINDQLNSVRSVGGDVVDGLFIFFDPIDALEADGYTAERPLVGDVNQPRNGRLGRGFAAAAAAELPDVDSGEDMTQPMTTAYKRMATIAIFRPNMSDKQYRTRTAVAKRAPIIRIRCWKWIRSVY